MSIKSCRRDLLRYGTAAIANIGAFSTLGYAVSRLPGDAAASSAAPAVKQSNYLTGRYGPLVDWPIIAIHAVLLPSGAVMSFGTDQSGNQGAFIHDVWDPGLGGGPESHYTPPNGVAADFFCSAASLQINGTVLIADGDLTISGVRNYSNDASSIFAPRTNTITSGPPTGSARWYPSFVSLPDGEKAIFGGISQTLVSGQTVDSPVLTPQITHLGKSWQALGGATSEAAFGSANYPSNWFYPRANVIPGGKVAILTNDGLIFLVDTSGRGSITQVGQVPEPGLWGSACYPTVSYAPGQWLSVRGSQVVIKVEFDSSGSPTVTLLASLDQDRIWGNGTILADGRVLVNGGSTVANELVGVAYTDTIWDPTTEAWIPGATASVPRLYHNTSLLLKNGAVLTAGGGAPGPLVNLNAQIYYPSYLFAPDGRPAVRPTLAVSPKRAAAGNVIYGTVGAGDSISGVTALRMGSNTHDYNSDQRFLQLDFTQTGQTVSAQLPADTSVLIPGYWMIFAWNDQGAPSTAAVLLVTASGG
jgi:hypothetical protein